MTKTIDAWDNFKTMILTQYSALILNKGLTDHDIKKHQGFINNYHFPDEILKVLHETNGQDYNSNPIFLEFQNGILGLNFCYYKFLSLTDIIETHNFMQSYSKGKIDMNLIPFAKIEKTTNDNGTTTFTIHNTKKTIYKTFCFINDYGYKPIYEFRSEKFANNLNEFLENQILWYGLR
jgi:hypothetical protein